MIPNEFSSPSGASPLYRTAMAEANSARGYATALTQTKGRHQARDRGAPPSAAGVYLADFLKSVGGAAIALVAFVITLPLMAAAWLAVRLTSSGPGIYSQTRVGLHGRTFVIYKLRTMYHDCERLSGPLWSPRDDPRITPIGRFLRLTHLDELPQFWNVLRGDMVLVGPRPERPEFIARLEREVPGYRDRESISPGLTGLAQIRLPADTEIGASPASWHTTSITSRRPAPGSTSGSCSPPRSRWRGSPGPTTAGGFTSRPSRQESGNRAGW